MAELEALEVENRISINKIQMMISGSNCNMNQIRKYKKELNTLILSMKRNAKMKNEFSLKYSQLEDLAKNLKEQLKQYAANNRDRQELLSQLFRLHMIELQNTELTAVQKKQSDLLRERDIQLKKLNIQLKLRDIIIRKQSLKLDEYEIDYDIPELDILMQEPDFQNSMKLSRLRIPSRSVASPSPDPSVASSDLSSQTSTYPPSSPTESTSTQASSSHPAHERSYSNPPPDYTRSYSTHPPKTSPHRPSHVQNSISALQSHVHNTNNTVNIQINSVPNKPVFKKVNSGSKKRSSVVPSEFVHPSQKLNAKRLKRQQALASIYGESYSKKKRKTSKKIIRRATPNPPRGSNKEGKDGSLFVSRFNSDFNEIYQDVIPKKEKSQKLTRKPRNEEQHNRLQQRRQQRRKKAAGSKKRPATLATSFKRSMLKAKGRTGLSSSYDDADQRRGSRRVSESVTRFPPLVHPFKSGKNR